MAIRKQRLVWVLTFLFSLAGALIMMGKARADTFPSDQIASASDLRR